MDKLLSTLLLMCVVLTPLARSAEIPLILMAIFGLILVVKQGSNVLGLDKVRKFSLLFLLLWLPIIFSATDSINQWDVVRFSAGYLRYYFFGVFVIYHLDDLKLRDRVVSWVSFLLLFWIGDALIQAFFGVDLFGFPLLNRVSGVFGKHVKLGLYLAVYSPILMIFIDRLKNKYVKIVLFVALVLVVLLAGSRGGWIMLAVACMGFAGIICLKLKTVPIRSFIVLMSLVVVVGIISYQTVPLFTARVDKSILVFSGDRKSIDHALAFRLPIWTIAVQMFEDHPLNGVGAKNFRYVYNDYAGPDDIFVKAGDRKLGALHAHTMILDVACESGIIGLVGLVGFCGLLLVFWFRSDRYQKLYAAPFAVGLLTALFPLNTHFDFYSSAWMQVIMWYTVLYVATIHSPIAREFCTEGNDA